MADDQGLSYYADATLSARLSMDGATLNKARQTLIRAHLIAYERPFYQVLALGPPRPLGELGSMRALLAQALGKTP